MHLTHSLQINLLNLSLSLYVYIIINTCNDKRC